MKLLKRKVKSATGIQLKPISRWLISESRLKGQQEWKNQRGSTIVITTRDETDEARLDIE